MALSFGRLFLPTGLGGDAAQQDYWAFYGGARAAWSGLPANPYDPSVFEAYVGAPSTLFWLYPPTMFLLLAPFAALSYGAAKLAWVILTLGCTVLLARLATGYFRLFPALLASPVAWLCLFVGQLGAVFGLWLVAGLSLARSRPVLAGACIALLTVKPPYGLLVVPFLLLARAWKALATAAALGAVFHLGSWAIFGSRSWHWFLQSAGTGTLANFLEPAGYTSRVTLRDAAAALGFSLPGVWLFYVLLLALASAALFVLVRRASFEFQVAFALAAAGVIAPYFFIYDYYPLYAAILMVAVRAPRIPAIHALIFGAIWLSPLSIFWTPATVIPAILWTLNGLGALAVFHLGWMGGD